MDILTLKNAPEILRDPARNPIKLVPVYPITKRDFFYLEQDITVQLSTGDIITIPAGFTTDLSSVPRPLWSAAAPFGDFLMAALIHDWLYKNNYGTRFHADLEMYIWSVHVNPRHQWDNITRFAAVRWRGQSWWDS